jgi:AcrR family transcriptional regulator
MERAFYMWIDMSDKCQCILETALTLFRAHGYHAVGIDRVIAESGVAKMTMYRYFPSKNALIAAVLNERDQSFRDALIEFVNKVDDPREKLRALFLWHHHWFKESSFNGCMFINAVAEFPEINNSIRQASIRHKLLVQNFIESILNLVLTTELARQLAAQFSQLLDGAIIAVQVAGDPMAAFVAWRSAVGLLLLEGVPMELGNSFEPA